jgi:hypothetical protein
MGGHTRRPQDKREPPIWMLARRTALPLRPRQKAYSVTPCPLAPGMDTTRRHAPACPLYAKTIRRLG